MISIKIDKSRLEIDMIHQFLKTSYWAKGRTIEDVQKSIDHSLCFGLYKDEKQIGFARILTDYTVFAYLMDLFILPEYREKGCTSVSVFSGRRYYHWLLDLIFQRDYLYVLLLSIHPDAQVH